MSKDLKHIEPCGQFLVIQSKKNNAIDLGKAGEPSPKPSAKKKSKTSRTTKNKNTKQVKREVVNSIISFLGSPKNILYLC